MVRTQDPSKKIDAINHARKYLVSNQDPDSKEIQRAAGMLVFAQDTRAEPYKVQGLNHSRPICPD
jgi:macrophage erythroblast attacher